MADPCAYTIRMKRVKASVDRRIESAQTEQGLFSVSTGAGKGKTTAALGMALSMYRPRYEDGSGPIDQGGS